MNNLLKTLKEKNIQLPENVYDVLANCKSIAVFNTTDELADASTGGRENDEFEVKYDVPGKGEYTEAIIHRVKNGISANYTEPYMRRRDPGTMSIADDLPTDKKRFNEKYGTEIGVSVGIAKLNPESLSIKETKEYADRAMYASKQKKHLEEQPIAIYEDGIFEYAKIDNDKIIYTKIEQI